MSKPISIIVPVNDWNAGAKFYRDLMGFYEEGHDFYLPNTPSRLCLNLMVVSEQWRKYGAHGGRPRVPLFRYPLESGFLSYCQERYERGVRFASVAWHADGYLATIVDPFGNTFQVHCDSRQDEEPGIDPSGWRFHDGYQPCRPDHAGCGAGQPLGGPGGPLP